MSERISFAATAEVRGDTLVGVAHAFGAIAKVGGRYETMAPGSFDNALKSSDARALVEHDRSKVLGRQSSGTLRLSATPQGLAYEVDLPDTTYANDLKALVARGDIGEASFSFVPGTFTLAKSADGKQVRTHTSVAELIDISPVALPAFDGTSVALRSAETDSARSQMTLARFRAAHKGDK